jgi:hypothetical protein
MNTTNDQERLKSRMENGRTILAIIIVLGWVLLLVGTIIEGFDGGTVIWVLAVLDATLFWFFARRFLETPSHADIKNLRTIFYSFVFVWILAVAVSFLIWGELYADTIFGALLFLVATFFMNQFISRGKMYLTEQGNLEQGEV